jgi:hypothetical protein
VPPWPYSISDTTLESPPVAIQGVLPAPPVVTPPDQGGGGRRHKKHLYYVEIDGEQFRVSTEAEALDILEQARVMAVNAAPLAAAKAIVNDEPAPKPRVVVSPALLQPLRAELAEARAEINKAYADAYEAAVRQAAEDGETIEALHALDQHTMESVLKLLTILDRIK